MLITLDPDIRLNVESYLKLSLNGVSTEAGQDYTDLHEPLHQRQERAYRDGQSATARNGRGRTRWPMWCRAAR